MSLVDILQLRLAKCIWRVHAVLPKHETQPLVISETLRKSGQNGEVPGLDADKNAEKLAGFAPVWPTKDSYLENKGRLD
jgi:hypothetical protein